MESLLLENNTATSFQTKNSADSFFISAVLQRVADYYILSDWHQNKYLFSNKNAVGTSAVTIASTLSSKTTADDYETGYYNDNYDIVAKAPVTSTFKIKAKIKSITRYEAKTI